MTSVVLNMAAGVMQFHETADEEQKQSRHFEGLDVGFASSCHCAEPWFAEAG